MLEKLDPWKSKTLLTIRIWEHYHAKSRQQSKDEDKPTKCISGGGQYSEGKIQVTSSRTTKVRVFTAERWMLW